MSYYTVKEVQKILGISSSKAYQVIRQLNAELKAKGFITIAGKVSKKFFNERYYASDDDIKQAIG
jgi:hypothetical protein